MSDSTARIKDIELLRAVAIVFVLVAHAPALIGDYGADITAFEYYFDLGAGVDLFFVISGFVIARSLIAHQNENPEQDFKSIALSFWIRRAFRILPAAWFWIGIGLVATVVFNKSGIFGHFLVNLSDALAAILQYANFHWWKCSYAPAGTCAAGGIPNGVYWSLSLEEQFYFLFPFVYLLTPRRLLPLGLVICAIVQIFQAKIGLTWWVRSDGLLLGVLIALYNDHPISSKLEPLFLRHTIANRAAFVGLSITIGVVGSPAFSLLIPWNSGLLAMLCGILVTIASYGKGYVAPKELFNPITMWIGSRSYSLYLCHFMAYCATNEIWFRLGLYSANHAYSLRVCSVGVFLLYAFAELSFRQIESPFRQYGHSFTQKPKKSVGTRLKIK